MNQPAKRVWCVRVYVHATEEEVDEVAERLGVALCPEPSHPGYCSIPWATETSRPTGTTAKIWEEHFAEERAAAEASGD